VVEDGFECRTHLINGEMLSLSWKDMRYLLDRLPRVFSYKSLLPIYLNPNAISTYSSTGYYVSVKFRNGTQLNELSRVDFDKNVLSEMTQGRGL
jgi:hypothetical protein